MRLKGKSVGGEKEETGGEGDCGGDKGRIEREGRGEFDQNILHTYMKFLIKEIIERYIFSYLTLKVYWWV